MVKTLILNSSNFAGGNTFTYNFRNHLNAPTDCDAIALANISFYNSTFNITSSYGNNTLTLNWLGTNYTINFPNGYYAVNDINSYWQYFCQINGLYVLNSNNQAVYFIEVVTNSPEYAVQINFYAIPTSSQATSLSYTLPSGASWTWPSAASTPTLTWNSSFGSLIGLSSGTYLTTSQTTTSSFTSTSKPEISVVNSYVLTCDLINNPFSNPNNVFFHVP